MKKKNDINQMQNPVQINKGAYYEKNKYL